MRAEPRVTGPLNPAPVVYPACVHCSTPYVLRRVMNLVMPGSSLEFRTAWIWMRDCAGPCRRSHRRPDAKVVDDRKAKKSRPAP